MEGTRSQPGVIPRALDELFRRAHEERATRDVTISLSMIEVYNDCVHELLSAHGGGGSEGTENERLQLRSDANGAYAVGAHLSLLRHSSS